MSSNSGTHYYGDGCAHWHGEDGKYGVNLGEPYVTTEALAPREIRVVDPTTGGEKGQKPEQYSLIPVAPLAAVSRVYGFGAGKYAPNNWRRGYAWSLSFDAMLRHIHAARSGEWLDPESGQPHLAHAEFHCNTLMEFERLGLGTDDRGDK